MQPLRIERVDASRESDDLRSLVTLHVAAALDIASPVSELCHYAGLDPGYLAFLAFAQSRPVGAATLGRCFMYDESFDGGWTTVVVPEPERGQGVGTALYRAVSEAARARGWSTLVTSIQADRPGSMAWAERRGFRETERSRAVELALAGMARPDVAPPPGIEITTLAERPDLADALYAVAVEAYDDIPHRTEPVNVGTPAHFRAHELNHPSTPHEGFFIATAEGSPVGYASMVLLELEPDAAFHGMTAVMRAWRGRGVATALKRACIGWGMDQGLRRLLTDNDLANAPMRAVNATLGYTPRPDRVLVRGPIAPEV
jgi:mycothiol synthase